MGLLREWCRRFQIARHAPWHWTLRRGTIDRRLFRSVVLDNEYRLPPRFNADDVILDIGAHVGSFALACLRRGAGHVVCCEPDADNFALLSANLAPYYKRMTLLRAAVWRNDIPSATLTIHNPLDERNTGAIRVGPGSQSVRAIAFDELIASLGKRLRLAKLDCEGAEWPILLTTRSLAAIDELCGEYHLGDYPDAYHVAGQSAFTPGLLEQTLRAHGFAVEFAEAPGSSLPVGLFFARRDRSS
jgi:FkbM family methyltransferase